ncbi:MerR family transcriptional regulator [Acetivibrio ethanolgignens]|uniref:MerR family transcriptional regulator n=1 Tax=Acetivibrio ethanolgignens TaxID=290052 RepID=A0A0V8QGS9_9FIRM|nr:MerR family transcriptional regulator [Acetivibrio ethanolgignens]KSV59819.1 MerR family transcriptional regulator [Acetivibrio ethanolgignens]
MLMNEIKEKTGLTKKAIEYYTEKGLVVPEILENGYRNYSREDAEILKKTAVLRKLDLGVEEIRRILSGSSDAALQAAEVKKELTIQREQIKREILNELGKGKSYEEIRQKLSVLEQSKTIAERLLEAFPGYYGRYICLHFANFLNEPIETESQQNAYERILAFLDNAPMPELPEDLKEYVAESTKNIGVEQINGIIANNRKAVENPDAFLAENKEFLGWYLEYKQSEEYKNSPAYRLTELMKEWNQESGYYDIFIPALKELSSSYAEYCRKLENANEAFSEKYPEI